VHSRRHLAERWAVSEIVEVLHRGSCFHPLNSFDLPSGRLRRASGTRRSAIFTR
jgi:hypothetical protein